MPITYDEAYAKTNPELTEDQRKNAAAAIMAGVAANDAYWQHTDELTRLKAQADGHGQVPDVSPPTPTQTSIESTASEDTPDTGPDTTDTTDAAAKLRKQLTDSGITPAA